jgi:hypothetical protein
VWQMALADSVSQSHTRDGILLLTKRLLPIH